MWVVLSKKKWNLFQHPDKISFLIFHIVFFFFFKLFHQSKQFNWGSWNLRFNNKKKRVLLSDSAKFGKVLIFFCFSQFPVIIFDYCIKNDGAIKNLLLLVLSWKYRIIFLIFLIFFVICCLFQSFFLLFASILFFLLFIKEFLSYFDFLNLNKKIFLSFFFLCHIVLIRNDPEW